MSSVVDGLASIWESIKSLPLTIAEKVGDTIKGIFVPDTDVIQEQYETMLSDVQRSLGLQLDSLDWLVNGITEEPLEDVKAEYRIMKLGKMELTFLDTTYLKQGIEFFRPLIRGFVVFLLILYNYKQILTFIGQDPSIAHHAEARYEKYLERRDKK